MDVLHFVRGGKKKVEYIEGTTLARSRGFGLERNKRQQER